MATEVGELGTILGVWAHPDDETYLSAGVMAAAIEHGQRVVCVTATRGEAGSIDEERWPPETMGDVREEELMRCLAILGVKEHHWLGYPDGGCDAIDREEATARIVAFIEEVQPDSVLTFGPDGMTDHADHKAVNAWTTEAFRRVGKPGARLYYATQTKEWADVYVPILNQFNVFGPGTPPITPEDELAIDLHLEDGERRRKVDAIMAHDSQVDGMRAVFGENLFLESQIRESYRLGEAR